jgi:hypothetical protein
MASSINASTSGAGGVITTADNTGILNLQSGGSNIATISSTGLALNAGNITLPSGAAPAFSVYPAASVTISNVTHTLAQCNTKSGSSQLFDTGGCFNNTGSSTTLNGLTAPAYSFTPNVAGYYLIGVYAVSNAASGTMQPTIYINGVALNQVAYSVASDYRGGSNQLVSYFNGTGDYVQFYFFQSSGGSITTLASRPDIYKFYGFMIRSA